MFKIDKKNHTIALEYDEKKEFDHILKNSINENPKKKKVCNNEDIKVIELD